MNRSHIVPALCLSCMLLIVTPCGAQSVESPGATGSASNTNDLAAPELVWSAPGSTANPVNQASISQASELNVAHITQSGLGNYAVIIQSGHSASVAVIKQSGNYGRAVIRQN